MANQCSIPSCLATCSVSWDKIKANFATRDDILGLISDIERLEKNQITAADNLSQVVTAQVLASVMGDIKKLGGFRVEICNFKNTDGSPDIKNPDSHTLYLVPASHNTNGDNYVEWIYIDPNGPWEQVGARYIDTDITFLKNRVDDINVRLDCMAKAIQTHSADLARLMLKKITDNMAELKTYVSSPEFITYIKQSMPLADENTDGIMSASHVQMINGLVQWASETDQNGGGSLDYNYVTRAMREQGIID